MAGPNFQGPVKIQTTDNKDRVTLKTVLKQGGNYLGVIEFFSGVDKRTILLAGDGSISLGGQGATGSLRLYNSGDTNTIYLNAQTGDILLSNADCAEEFEVSTEPAWGIEPGTVMVINNDGKLNVSSKAYDNRVAGVISGARGYKPGIVLDKKKSDHIRVPVAMMGKVYCKVDANYSSIQVGDMLTTSPTLGHAMRATNRSRAFGSVIGKALDGLAAGKSLIPVLIALQ